MYILSRFTAHVVVAEKFWTGVNISDATVKFLFGTVAEKYILECYGTSWLPGQKASVIYIQTCAIQGAQEH